MNDPEEFEDLIQGHLDGSLSPEDHRKLGELVKRSPAFARRLALASRLDVLTDRLLKVPNPSRKATRRSVQVERKPLRRWLIPIVAVAALLLIAVTVMLTDRARRPAEPSGPSMAGDPPKKPTIPEAAPEKPAPKKPPTPETQPAPVAPPEQAQPKEVVTRTPEPPVPPVEPERKPRSQESTPPQPPKSEPPAPAPPPAVQKPEPSTVAIAQVEALQGDVRFRVGQDRVAVKPGQSLTVGQGVESTGPLSWALLRLTDGTRLELWGDSILQEISEDQAGGKRTVVVTRGRLYADVAKQGPGRVLAFKTPQAEATVLGTRLLLSVDADPDGQTLLEVGEGRVKLARASDGASVEVNAGGFSIAKIGLPLQVRPLQGDKAKAAHPGVDQKKVDQAIQKGVDWLLQNGLKPPAAEAEKVAYDEIVLYTLLHAGVSQDHPVFQSLLKKTLESDLSTTYRVALHAMFLAEFDPTTYQRRLAECCQFLVDNQCANGQWSYGTPTTYLKDYPTQGAAGVATGGPRPKAGSTKGTRPKTLLTVKRQREGPKDGDNSNSQYAALGIRACLESNVLPPMDTLDRAKKSWEASQNEAGSWGYWGTPAGDHYGSMSAGGLGSLILYKHALKENWRTDKSVTRGLEWMAANFSADVNPKILGPRPSAQEWHFYYLYAAERLGVFAETAVFGRHDWYREGANKILGLQRSDGSWDDASNPKAGPSANTCFAILFLRRGTRPLTSVASVDRFIQPK